MALNYQGDKNHHDHGNQWTSYSDLFMGLSVIFLLLYVTSSLRTGTNGLQQQLEREKLVQESRDLKAQLQVYNTLRKDYMKTDATTQDEAVYKELMDKLSLLQDEAKDEKQKLLDEAFENEKKEKALNQYQQMVRNIVNANMVAKARIKKRDDVIKELDEDVTDQDVEINQLESTVEQKRRQLVESQKQIEKAEQELENRKNQLKSAFRNQEISKKKFEKQLAELEQDNNNKVDELKTKARAAEQQLESVSGKLANVNKQLTNTQSALSNTKEALAAREAEARNLEGKIGSLKSEYASQAAAEKAKFDREMNAARLSAAERAKKEGEFRAAAQAKERELAGRVQNLSGKLGDTEKALAKAKAEIEAKRSVSKDIKDAFRKAGVKADIDEETGDVILDFGENYFATGSSNLNGEMMRVLEKAVPLYTKALFENDKVAKKLGSVEIIGFASPTYKGKYLNPDELSKVDKKAIDYNLDLSYKRAKSIFNHIFDSQKMNYDHQKELQPLVKVSGRSFFSESKNSRGTPGLKTDSCAKGDCSKAQKVIIKYTLDY